MTLAAQLAQRINQISWEKLPRPVVANAKNAILDTVGVMQGYRNPAPDVGDHYAVDLSVTLKSGARITIRRERPCGRTPADPTPPERVKAKFESCAARVLGSAKAPRLYAALDELEKMSSLRELIADAALRA